MLPLQLRLENFASFREASTVDFTGVDYFALVGSTGAGKTTIIDGICFALYGTVPRWGREGQISLALAPSSNYGRVALVFESGGHRYGVVRALTRTSRGAVQTREARLDELDQSLPADAGVEKMLESSVRPLAEGDQVTGAVSRITGLEYKYFTQCVVLPQGRFAEFLHAPPRERQDLLVQLLDADVYERVRARAEQEKQTAQERSRLAHNQLARLSDADEEAEKNATSTLHTLQRVADDVASSCTVLSTYESDLRAAADELTTAEAQCEKLAALVMPPEVTRLADELATAEAAAKELADQLAMSREHLDRATSQLEAAGDKSEVDAALAAHTTAAGLRGKIAEYDATVEQARTNEETVREEVCLREEEFEKAQRRLQHVQDAHTAASLASRLAAGDTCPVCQHIVDEESIAEPPEDLATVEDEVSRTRKQRDDAGTRLRQAEKDHHGATQARHQLHEQLEALRPTLEVHPDRASLERQRAAIDKAEADRKAAWRQVQSLHKQQEASQQKAVGLRDQTDKEWSKLHAARDTVALRQPPVLPRDDLRAGWRALLEWRDADQAQLAEWITKRREATDTTRSRHDELHDQLVSTLAKHGVAAEETTATGLTVAARTAVTRAEAHLERVRDNRRSAQRLRTQADENEKAAGVAADLALLLRANAFERWLCEEALALLVDAASATLRELSGGQYELALGDKNAIEIVDYAEAGMRRNVRTLSGGETFQAALALALALSEQVAGLAAAAERSLDSVFLDEGFGTLDPATLDTVAATLERLAASGDRMVGVVTHVPALAERVPVRFEVTRDDRGSHVTRVTL